MPLILCRDQRAAALGGIRFHLLLQRAVEVRLDDELILRVKLGEGFRKLFKHEPHIARSLIFVRRLGEGGLLRFLRLLRRQYALFFHEVEHQIAPLFARRLVAEGRIAVGRAHQSRQHGALGGHQFARVLPEVVLRGAPHPESAVPEVDGVEIELQNLLLRVTLFKLKRQLPFFELAADGLLPRKMGVLDELLRDGRSPFAEGKARDISERRLPDA